MKKLSFLGLATALLVDNLLEVTVDLPVLFFEANIYVLFMIAFFKYTYLKLTLMTVYENKWCTQSDGFQILSLPMLGFGLPGFVLFLLFILPKKSALLLYFVVLFILVFAIFLRASASILVMPPY